MHHQAEAAKFKSNQKKLSSLGINIVGDEIKASELKMAVYVATHSAIKSVDHLGELLVILGQNSTLASIRLHRTKCSRLITQVIAPALLEALVEDVGNQPFSLILDESTDVSVQKHLAICIRYSSSRQEGIITNFLGIVTLTDATAIVLYKRLDAYLRSIKININNLVAIGTDGASAMCGVNHSLFTQLRDNVPLPNLMLVKCICHSLHLCSSKASEVLPSSLEFLIRESRNWSACSPLRQAQYADLFHLINDNDTVLLKLVQLSTTRWLAWEGAVRRILSQYLELSTHFNNLAEATEKKCHMAKYLSCMYKDPTNHLYLVFLKSILSEVNSTNTFFQSTHQDIAMSYQALWTLLMSVASRIVKPLFLEKAKSTECISDIEEALKNELALLTTKSTGYGIEFETLVSKSNLKCEELQSVRIRCREYLIVLCTELIKRMPSHFSILKMTSKFSPSRILSVLRPLSITDLPVAFINKDEDISKVENQLRQIRFVDWVGQFGIDVVQDTNLFWSKIYSSKDAGGRQQFQQLSLFALKVLSMPLSNAIVERVFSIMNAVKTKSRNKMQFEMLEALLRIRTHFIATKMCCNSFQPTAKMFELFTAKMYDYPSSRAKSTGAKLDDLEILQETLTLFGAEDFGADEYCDD